MEDPTIKALCGGMGNVMPWWLFGAAGDCDGIEVDYLNGQEIPNIRRMEAPGQLGFVWDIFLDWGISVMAAVKDRTRHQSVEADLYARRCRSKESGDQRTGLQED